MGNSDLLYLIKTCIGSHAAEKRREKFEGDCVLCNAKSFMRNDFLILITKHFLIYDFAQDELQNFLMYVRGNFPTFFYQSMFQLVHSVFRHFF
jgi:hypothetical protein